MPLTSRGSEAPRWRECHHEHPDGQEASDDLHPVPPSVYPDDVGAAAAGLLSFNENLEPPVMHPKQLVTVSLLPSISLPQ